MLLSAAAVLMMSTGLATAGDSSGDRSEKSSQGGVCAGLPSHAALETALKSARAQANGGFDLHMWGTVVNRDGGQRIGGVNVSEARSRSTTVAISSWVRSA